MTNKILNYSKDSAVLLRSMDGTEENKDSRTIYGCAIKFDVESQYIGYYEIIKRGAVTQELIDKSDIYARLNHDESTVLARSRYGKGSLKLELREDGLYYEFEAPHTVLGDELIEHIKRGEIETSSFAFSLAQDEKADYWEQDDNGDLRRYICKIGALYDVSPVYEPAYLATSCDKRAKEVIDSKDILNKKYELALQELASFEI